MGGLIQAGVYNESKLFYSDNLITSVDYRSFDTPWLYREEFSLEPTDDQHYFLQTNGISSRADIYLNGELVASKDTQIGAYGGWKYDVTNHVKTGPNCLLIRAHQTNYLRDLAAGFIDWNPYPPDNGTGIWRNVEFLQTGPVSICSPRIVTNFVHPGVKFVKVTVKVEVQNHQPEKVRGQIIGSVAEEDGGRKIPLVEPFYLDPNEKKTISIIIDIDHPKIWWPALWGEQPLYSVKLQVKVGDKISDVAEERKFGIRHVASHVNSNDALEFKVNGQYFLVMGAGYTSDIFLRFDANKLETQFQYMLDMGLNTVRLEGKLEHPELYEIADRMGMMIMAGWECCNKWEGWTYNNEGFGEVWKDEDYYTANVSMLHEAAMMQNHPSILAFLVGSDFWPDDRATKIYVDAMKRMDWPNPIISSAAKRGFPKLLGPSGMKMAGPYDWVPPNYWYGGQLGAAFGFGSELGPGVGTPELESLTKFLSKDDLEDLWTKPNQNLFHMSKAGSQFQNRTIYNNALYARYGKPKNIDDYLLKAQIMDYEATRSEFEGFAAAKSAENRSTGLIYWMLNGAWPSLHWQLFDYYLHKSASYYGARVGTRPEHVSYNYHESSVYLINHSLTGQGKRTIILDLIDVNGTNLSHKEIQTDTMPNSAKRVTGVPERNELKDVAFMRLLLIQADSGAILSRNVYWLAREDDTLDWGDSSWYHTPVSKYSDFTSLENLSRTAIRAGFEAGTGQLWLENETGFPAFFVRFNLVDQSTGEIVTPVYWSDNYITLWPKEKIEQSVSYNRTQYPNVEVKISGYNVLSFSILPR
ncbi:conserved hypothetical protein [Uncinocarpus reesii 1704]|uniref:Uncharacterized protein n=1 Tax=Uncinocarpus reesii (strain UAMH 1704) TaxID=336963 RepID=C4JG87_UNCRE|nr:uncharacterized protein UREG_02485 [Uncinocarpus reesii 1704]EEP77636.1 conserved hypothetical protein [Uncinocarpus reesii 1704]